MLTAYLVQSAFRARNDNGSETSATWKAALNTNWSQNVDEVFRVRIGMTETNGGAINNVDLPLQYSLNGGTWTNVTTSTPIRFTASAYVSDNTVTTQQITSGTWASDNSEFDSDGVVGNAPSFTANSNVEYEACLTINSLQVNNNDTIALRKSGLNAWNQTPTITVVEVVPVPVVTVAVFQNFATYANVAVSGTNSPTQYYLVVTNSATTPSISQIKAGQDHTGASALYSGNNATGIFNTGQTFGPNTTYYLHGTATNSGGDGTPDSTSWTTSSVTISNLSVTAVANTQLEISCTNFESLVPTCYAVVTNSATVPSGAQIVAGQDHTGSAAIDSGTFIPELPTTFTTTQLSPSTLYYVHVVASINGGYSNILSGSQTTSGVGQALNETLGPESSTITESFEFALSKPAEDSVSVSETAVLDIDKISSDLLAISEQLSFEFSFIFTPESFTSSDIFSVDVNKLFSETVGLTEAFEAVLSKLQNVTENLSISESYQFNLDNLYIENLTVTENLIKDVDKQNTDTVSVTDVFQYTLGGLLTLTPSDLISITDAKVLSAEKTTTVDSVGFTEVFSYIISLGYSQIDSISVSDSIKLAKFPKSKGFMSFGF